MLRAEVAIEVLTKIFLVVGIVADLGSRRLEARLACNLRRVLILAIERRDPPPADELTTAFTFDGRTSRTYEDRGGEDDCTAWAQRAGRGNKRFL